MRRIATLISTFLLVMTGCSALAAASVPRATLQLRNTRVGTILVNGRGFTLYAFTKDSRNRDACVNIRGCLGVWPAVTTVGKPVAGRGVKASLIGTINVSGVGKQVTYAGHALYRYIADRGPGQTFYVNIFQFKGRWPALNAAGQEVK